MLTFWRSIDYMIQFSSVHFIYFTTSYNIHFVTLQPKYQPATNYTEKERIVQTYIYILLGAFFWNTDWYFYEYWKYLTSL